ncbi:MAG: hypothetical protein HAW62_04140 [Endozoicomonadaceae bacterium]|nr:hypothetical protein [Endozoicomonadaceae bacterium]
MVYHSAVATKYAFFGDGQIDTGNHPEPCNIKNSSINAKTLYIPIGNPVKEIDFNSFFLKTSLKHQMGTSFINGEKKTLYTVNWPLYFVYTMSEGKTPLIPWIQHKLDPKTTDQHINYAWANSFIGAKHEQFNGIPGMFYSPERLKKQDNLQFEGDIVASRYAYRQLTEKNLFFDDHPSCKASLVIPNLSQQISLYLHEYKQDTSDTIFFIETGLNDIEQFITNHYLSLLFMPVFNSALQVYIQEKIDSLFQQTLRLIKSFEAANQLNHCKIYIIIPPYTLPYTQILAKKYTIPCILTENALIHNISRCFQSMCNQMSRLKDRHPNIRIFDVNPVINSLINRLFYIDENTPVHTPCDRLDVNKPILATTQDHRHYAFWDHYYMTHHVHEHIANQLSIQIKSEAE